MASEIPELIEVRCNSNEWHMLIDGVEFPWPVRNPIVGPVDRQHFPEVTVTLMARHVTAEHSTPPAPFAPKGS